MPLAMAQKKLPDIEKQSRFQKEPEKKSRTDTRDQTKFD
jgi:hypothetical protein